MDPLNLPVVRHAGLIARHLGGLWRGVMIEGVSGAGKSDLALRALDLGFRLVADDRVLVFLSGGRLFGRAPRPLEGLIEARGVGIVRSPYLGFVEIRMIARAIHDPRGVERLPEPSHELVLGLKIPVLELWPREDSAATKLRWALAHLGQPSHEAYQASRVLPQPRVQGGASGVEGDCR